MRGLARVKGGKNLDAWALELAAPPFGLTDPLAVE
jgi:hypothetical protein